MDNGAAVNPDTQDVIICTGVEHGDERTFDYVLQKCNNSVVPTERQMFIDALASTKDPKLLTRLISYALNELSASFLPGAMGLVAANPIGRALVWPFLKENWAKINEKWAESNEFDTICTQNRRNSLDRPTDQLRVHRRGHTTHAGRGARVHSTATGTNA